MKSNSGICQGPIGRRSFLEAGSLALGGLGLGDLLRSRSVAKEAGQVPADTSIILILPKGMQKEQYLGVQLVVLYSQQ